LVNMLGRLEANMVTSLCVREDSAKVGKESRRLSNTFSLVTLFAKANIQEGISSCQWATSHSGRRISSGDGLPL
jgi:hypothetical protein